MDCHAHDESTDYTLILVRVAFHQLDADVVWPFDKSVFAARAGVGAVSHFDAVFLQAIERLVEIVDTEADVVGNVAFGGFKISAVFPQLRPLRFGIFHGEDDEVDVVHHEARGWADLKPAIEPWLAPGRTGGAAELARLLELPLSGGRLI